MPLIEASSYRAPWFLPGAHWQTIAPNITRRRIRINFVRERFELPDTDFMDMDWLQPSSAKEGEKCCVLIHGLEGSSRAPYIKALARSLDRAGYRVGALNLRGCSGEPNRLKRFYHSGDTEGLASILEMIADRFAAIHLVGFSLGGNVALKYLGEDPLRAPSSIRSAVAISVPCDLEGGAAQLAEKKNALYMKRFIVLLCAKLKAKEKRYPHYAFSKGCSQMATFHDFDGTYTAPLNGFRDAVDYWNQSSSKPLLGKIEVPSLMINALNDPFLPQSCYPVDIARQSSKFHLEMPRWGGHCGFPGARDSRGYWHERRILEFFDSKSRE